MLQAIVKKIEESGKRLEFKPNSVLAAIQSNPAETSYADIASLIGDSIIKDLDFNKDDVLPLVRDITTDIDEGISKYVEVNPVSKYSIILTEVPEFLGELKSKNIVTRDAIGFDGIPDNGFSLKYEATGKSDFFRRFLTPFENLNNDILDYIEGVTEEEFETIWNKYLGNANENNANFSTIAIFNPMVRKELVMMFFVTKKMETNPLWTIPFSIDKYRNVMSIVHAFFNNSILQLDTIEAALKTNKEVVVPRRPVMKDTDIYVNRANYLEYLNEGGSADVIIGTTIYGNRFTISKDELLEDKEKYISALNNFTSLKAREMKLSQGKVFHSVTFNSARKEIDELSEKELKKSLELNGLEDKRELLVKANEVLTEYFATKEADIMNVNEVSELIVTDIIYTNTSATRFLKLVSKYASEINSKDSKEIVAFVTWDIITDYLLAQIEIV